MKLIVTHSSPDMDAITSVWIIRRFLPGWENAEVRFVPAGERLQRLDNQRLASSSQSQLNARSYTLEAIEKIGEDEIIHVDTGLGPLDHHQTASDKVCGASLTFDFVKRAQGSGLRAQGSDKADALSRMVKVVVDIDHFKEVFRKDPLEDYQDFDLSSILEGLKLQFPDNDDYYVEFVSKSLDAILHAFENRIWAEKEIKEKGIEFQTRFGKGIGFETINDSVVKLSQKMGYVLAVRRDPRKGYVRIKARPSGEARRQSQIANRTSPIANRKSQIARREFRIANGESRIANQGVDLTLAYEKLKKMDPEATWFLHVSKKMLLNGSVKNPKMKASKLSLNRIIKVLEKI